MPNQLTFCVMEKPCLFLRQVLIMSSWLFQNCVNRLALHSSLSVSDTGIQGMCHYHDWLSFLSSGNIVTDSEVLILFHFMQPTSFFFFLNLFFSGYVEGTTISTATPKLFKLLPGFISSGSLTKVECLHLQYRSCLRLIYNLNKK